MMGSSEALMHKKKDYDGYLGSPRGRRNFNDFEGDVLTLI